MLRIPAYPQNLVNQSDDKVNVLWLGMDFVGRGNALNDLRYSLSVFF